jgi:hypothetical protein
MYEKISVPNVLVGAFAKKNFLNRLSPNITGFEPKQTIFYNWHRKNIYQPWKSSL